MFPLSSFVPVDADTSLNSSSSSFLPYPTIVSNGHPDRPSPSQLSPPVNSSPPIASSSSSSPPVSSAVSSNSGVHFCQVIYSGTSNTWITITDILKFLPSEDPNVIKFIWASEDTGWRHLYLITAQIGNPTNDVMVEAGCEYNSKRQDLIAIISAPLSCIFSSDSSPHT